MTAVLSRWREQLAALIGDEPADGLFVILERQYGAVPANLVAAARTLLEAHDLVPEQAP